MPFPMQAVLLSRDQVDVSLQDLQRELTQCEVHPWLGGAAAASAGDALLTAS